MKNICLLLAFSIISQCVAGQKVVSNLIVVKTKQNEKFKGILITADTNKVVLADENSNYTIKTNTIDKIAVRAKKKSYVPTIITPAKVDYNNFRDGKYYDQWGNEEPTLKDQLGVGVMSVFFNVIINTVSLPIHAINPNIAKYQLSDDLEATRLTLKQLNFYSVGYQNNPLNRLDELKALKEVSASTQKK